MIVLARLMRTLILGICLSLPCLAAVAETDSSEGAVESPLIVMVDINNDSAEKMSELLKGIGPKIAQRIVDYRESNGPFETIDGLTAVKGVGEKTLEKNKHLLKI